ncbi:flagellar hook-associated protein FlgL [Nocardioides sp. YIM 152315]|uniref:flagellar hook-associated protein FlgL n=1 Tax=Nocardioides sp. YIM 152315 TaxID=3031760 RepID=UPI0023DA403E|nr:flagellar hook-associated protein FlgL [Nocardioides sp. YIM 152315]MDF1605951.1 flagellar hook-associated protein FlgL [Nocardioides sp. YIM 152315]
MTLVRVTQNMLSRQSFNGMQTAMSRVATAQEQLTTGRLINRPSDDPTGATTAMRLRSSLASQQQYIRNADSAVGWLDQTDGTLSTIGDQITRARDIALQGANTGAMGPEARLALATEVDQIREGLISSANTQYLDRPIFGGITGGAKAYDANGVLADPTAVNPPVGGGVHRTIADDVRVRIDVTGPEVFGDSPDSTFDHLAALSTALKAGDEAGITTAITNLKADADRITNIQSEIGARTVRVERARDVATDATLTLTNALSEVENVDLAKATVDLGLQEVAYQAALGATARVLQPSLLDFLR